MSRSKGPGSPLAFRCAQARKERRWPDPVPEHEVLRTGQVRPRTNRGGAKGVRSLTEEHEYQCVTCGHRSWTNHVGILQRPMMPDANDHVQVLISGQAWYAAVDPGASSVPGEIGWPSPSSVRKVGAHGATFVYDDVPVELAIRMAAHLELVADAFEYGDPYTRNEGRACRRAAERIRSLPQIRNRTVT